MRPGHTLFGMTVMVDHSGSLPVDPSPAEEAKRIVRNGLADITLRGKPLVPAGPAPTDAAHAVMWSNIRGRADEIMVSPALYEWLLREAEISLWHGAFDTVRRAMVELEKTGTDGVDEVPVAGVDRDDEIATRRLAWARERLERAVERRRHVQRLAEMAEVLDFTKRHLDIELTEWQKATLLALDSYAFPQHHMIGVSGSRKPDRMPHLHWALRHDTIRPTDSFTITDPNA